MIAIGSAPKLAAGIVVIPSLVAVEVGLPEVGVAFSVIVAATTVVVWLVRLEGRINVLLSDHENMRSLLARVEAQVDRLVERNHVVDRT